MMSHNVRDGGVDSKYHLDRNPVIAILRTTKTDTRNEGPDIGVKVPARFQFSSFDGRLGWAPGTTERCWL